MHKLEILEAIPQSDIDALKNALIADAAAQNAPSYRLQPLGIFQRDADGNITAGLTGHIAWDWFYVDLLYVHPSRQRCGWGTRLMTEAEMTAQQRGCTGIWVWTLSFQASGFYQKQGYEIFCQFPDFPKGHQRIGFRKIFSAQKVREGPDDIGLSGTSKTLKGTDGYV